MYPSYLNPRVLRAVARRLTENVSQIQAWAGSNPDAPVEIAETFAEWTLDAAYVPGAEALPGFLRPTGRWWHQLRVDSAPRAAAYARSHYERATPQSARGRWRVVEVGKADSVAGIDDAIDWLDTQFPTAEQEVRLVVAPAYHLIAFWLVGGDDANDLFYLVAAPEAYADLRDRLVPTSELDQRLRDVGSIQGISFAPDPDR